MSRKRFSIAEVAKLAGVSPATISRVISNKPGVSESRRQEIAELLRELDYHPNVAARSLVGRKSGTLGFVIPREASYVFSNPYYLDMLKGISEEANKHGYRLLLSVTPREQSYAELFKSGTIDGLILTSARFPDDGVMQLIYEGFPFVLIGRIDVGLPAGKWCFVDIEHVKAGQEVTEYLLALNHTRIGYISGPMNYFLTRDRLRGYMLALQRHGIPYDEDYVAVCDGFMEDDGYYATVRLLGLNERPTAIFAYNDLMAIGAIKAIRECGLEVPDDVSVVGFDDILTSPFLDPPLTTVRHFPYKKAILATQVLVAMLNGRPTENKVVEVPFELVERRSCGPAKQTDEMHGHSS